MYYLPFHRFPMPFIKQTSCFYYIIKKTAIGTENRNPVRVNRLTVYCIKNRKERSYCKQII